MRKPIPAPGWRNTEGRCEYELSLRRTIRRAQGEKPRPAGRANGNQQIYCSLILNSGRYCAEMTTLRWITDAKMLRAFLGWLAWLQDRDIEGTALSFVVCQLTLAIAACEGPWAAANDAALVLFLPTVLLTGFFLRFLEGAFVLTTAFVATWYFLVPPQSSFALTEVGAVELGIFVLASCLIIISAVSMRKWLKRRSWERPGVPRAKADLIIEG